jgi:hypothetical protein
MNRVRLPFLVVIIMTGVLAHTLIPHSHPWDDPHNHAVRLAAHAQSDPTCSQVPMGALPGQPPPIWCLDPPETGSPTITQGTNSWLDEFDHHLSTASLGAGYRVFDRQGASIFRSQHWRHADHWMTDVSGRDQDGPGPWDFGGALMRPDRSFRFQNGMLIVEADVAAGIAEYAGNAWPELIVSTAPAPTGILVDSLYGYGVFGGQWAVGCRLQSSRDPICAMYDNTGRGAGEGGRTFEISSHQHEGAQVFGGGAHNPTLDAAWRRCVGTDPDTNCRDRFRWELSRDTLTMYVNGVKYMEHRGLPPEKQLPNAMLNGDVYVYFADWIFKPDVDAVRFHWDRLAVNPTTPPGPAPGAGAGAPPVPPTPTATPTPTSTPAPAACNPRPPVNVSSASGVAGRLDVTVRAGSGTLRSIRFNTPNNARIDAGDQKGMTTAFTVNLPAGTTTTTFVANRVDASKSLTVPFVAVDACGDWSTAVSDGSSATPVPTPTQQPGSRTVTFDDRAGERQVLSGQYPNGVIDWGSNRWYHSAPYGSLSTKSVSFTSDSTSATFRLVTPGRLVSLQAYNGASQATTVSLSCAGQPTRTVTVAARELATITTGWSGTCATVAVSAGNGWKTNFDNLVLN